MVQVWVIGSGFTQLLMRGEEWIFENAGTCVGIMVAAMWAHSSTDNAVVGMFTVMHVVACV